VAVVLKSSQEIEKMRRAGKVVREVLELVRSHVKPGATTLDLERVAEARITELVPYPLSRDITDFHACSALPLITKWCMASPRRSGS